MLYKFIKPFKIKAKTPIASSNQHKIWKRMEKTNQVDGKKHANIIKSIKNTFG